MIKMYKKIVLIAVIMVGGCGIVKYKKTKTVEPIGSTVKKKTVRYELEIQNDSTICRHRNGRVNK